MSLTFMDLAKAFLIYHLASGRYRIMKCSFKDTNAEICILFSLPLLLGQPRIGFCRLQQALQDITIKFIIPNPSTIYNFYRIISAKVCGVIPTTMLSAMQTLVL